MWLPQNSSSNKSLEMLHVRYFETGRGLVIVFAYFCRGSKIKNQTNKKRRGVLQGSTDMGTWGLNVVHMPTVYDRRMRDKQYYASAYVTNVSAFYQCSYCFKTIKQLLPLSITLVPSMLQFLPPRPKSYLHALLFGNS